MDLMQTVRERCSVRQFKETPIPPDALHDMLEAARLAPSGGNAQKHVFGIAEDMDLKLQLAQAAGDQMWIASAPIVFACCADVSWDMASLPEGDFGMAVNKLRFGEDLVAYTNRFPDQKAVCSLFANAAPLIPAEHIFLAAVSHGLSACFIGYLDVKKAGEILHLPGHLACLFLLPVGYPAEPLQRNEKKSIEEIIFHNRWA